MSTPPSPSLLLFEHHLEFARRLVETPSPPQSPSPRRDSSSRAGISNNTLNKGLIYFTQDHIVRDNRSANNRSASSGLGFDSTRSSQFYNESNKFSAPVLGEIDPNNQRIRPFQGFSKSSPSASLKKKKAVQILEQHGSPPHVRVTAGGRVVPSEQSPLCSPRYGYSAVNKNGGIIKFAPGYPPSSKTFHNFAKALPNGLIAHDPNGKLCQMVDGRFLPVPDNNGIPQLFIAAPNVNDMDWNQFNGVARKSLSPLMTATDKINKQSSMDLPDASKQLAALEKAYQRLEVERRNLDKTEVLKRSELTGKAYSQLIEKRMKLVTEQDEIRRNIKNINAVLDGDSSDFTMPSDPLLSTNQQQPLFPGQLPYMQNNTGWTAEGQVMTSNMFGQEYPFVFAPQYFPNLVPQMIAIPMAGQQSLFNVSSNQQLSSTNSDSSNNMHRVNTPVDATSLPFDAGKENDKSAGLSGFNSKSNLNPMSPIYEPPSSVVNTPEKTVQRCQNLPVFSTGSPKGQKSGHPQAVGVDSDGSMQRSSASSYATADFFPNNTRDYSLNKSAYTAHHDDQKASPHSSLTIHHCDSEEHISRPEKEHHNVNWNPTIPDQAFKTEFDVKSDFKEGYDAGLTRAAITDNKTKEYLDGYCQGLLQSVSNVQQYERLENAKPVVRLPSGSSSQTEDKDVVIKTDESKTLDLSDLQQVITAPDNEFAILSPTLETPSVDQITNKSLGAWTKRNNEAHSVIVASKNVGLSTTSQPGVSVADFAMLTNQYEPIRTFSAQTQPALQNVNVDMVHEAQRVFSSPIIEMKSVNTETQAVGFSTTYYAQFDGMSFFLQS